MYINNYTNFISSEFYLIDKFYTDLFIREGLTKSVSYDDFIKFIKKHLNNKLDYNVELITKSRGEYILLEFNLINIKDKINLVKQLLQIINNLGYLITNAVYFNDEKYEQFFYNKLDEYNNKTIIVYFLNKKFDEELYNENIHKLYHLAPKDIYLSKIENI